MIDLKKERICVTGGAGFLGRALCAVLRDRGVPPDQLVVPRRAEFDLTSEIQVERLYAVARPTIVIHLAAEVGGIGANQATPGRFFYANMAMGLHLIEHARRAGLRRFVQVGTVCAYPKNTPAPFREDALWEGYPEETNAPYGVAKKALFVMLEAYQRQYGLSSAVVLPANLYGPGDNFDPQTSHVIPALVRKVDAAMRQAAPAVECWGTGEATRDFLYVDDAAEAIVRATERLFQPTPVNLGTGREVSIRELVEMIARLCGYAGEIRMNARYPDGQPRRVLDTARARQLLDWQASVPLEEGLRRTIAWFRQSAPQRDPAKAP